MEHLKVHLRSRGEFAKHGPPAARAGELFVPTTREIDTGETVTVELSFEKGPRLLLRGTIKWRRAIDSERTRAGVGVVLAPEEQAKLSWLYDYVEGFPPGRREKRRLPLRLSIVYTAKSARRVNFTRDVNEDGCFVRAAELPAVGDTTELRIFPPTADYEPLLVRATVAWVQTKGDCGFGVQFECDLDERAELGAWLAQLEQDYMAARLPDEVLL